MERLAIGAVVVLRRLGGLTERTKGFLEKERIAPLYKAYFDLVKEQGVVQAEQVLGGYPVVGERPGYFFVVPTVSLVGGIEVTVRTKPRENYHKTSLDALQREGPHIDEKDLSLSEVILVGVSTPESRQKGDSFSIKWVTVSAREGIRTLTQQKLPASSTLEYYLYPALVEKKLREQGNRLAGKYL